MKRRGLGGRAGEGAQLRRVVLLLDEAPDARDEHGAAGTS
jgi:hypothetical protein